MEHRKTPNSKKKAENNESNLYFEQFGKLLQNGEHTDILFSFPTEGIEIGSHKAILAARSEYFRAMFKDGGMSESDKGIVEITKHSSSTFRRMLEFIYTNSVKDISSCSAEDIIQLLVLGNEYLMEGLQKLCERTAASLLNNDNIGKMMLIGENYGATELQASCHSFLNANIVSVRSNQVFRQDVADAPELALLVMDAIPESQSNATKRRRLTGNELSHSTETSTIQNDVTVSTTIGTSIPGANTIWQHPGPETWYLT